MAKSVSTGSEIKVFRMLLKVVQAMQAEKDLDRLLDLIISSITSVLRAGRSSLFLYDPETNELYDKIAEKSSIDQIRLPLGKGIVGAVARTLKPLNIKDAYHDERFDSSWDHKTGFRTKSILAMPLVTHAGKLIGVIEVMNKRRGAFTDTDMKVLSAFNTNAAIAIDSAFLVQQYIVKQRIENNMKIARTIQQGLLPKDLPETDKIQLAAHLEPAEEASGDYYDVFSPSKDELALVIADVTGHGIGPAIIMSEARALIRAVTGIIKEPAQILSEVNRHLSRDLTGGRFVTCCLFILNLKTGTARYANAGHEDVFVRRARSGKWISLKATGIPLGIIENTQILPGKNIRLGSGDLLLLATDGFTESFDKTDKTMFGTERLQKAADGAAKKHPTEIIKHICMKICKFTGGLPRRDDQTLLIAKFAAKKKKR